MVRRHRHSKQSMSGECLLLYPFSAAAPPAPSPGPTHTEPTSQPSMTLWEAAGTFCIHTVGSVMCVFVHSVVLCPCMGISTWHRTVCWCAHISMCSLCYGCSCNVSLLCSSNSHSRQHYPEYTHWDSMQPTCVFCLQ